MKYDYIIVGAGSAGINTGDEAIGGPEYVSAAA